MESGKRNAGRLLIDGPADGPWNMAVDEALLQSTAESREWTLRFYRWSEPVVSLGYFQSHADRESHAESRESCCVRRSTGGGAIVHDHELTYSLACPTGDRLSRKNEELYFTVHRAIKAALARQRIVVDLHAVEPRGDASGDSIGRGDKRVEPFLCFLRRSTGDIVFQSSSRDHKVCGSAQRRYKNVVLQHGSIILQTSDAAPQISGLSELAGTDVGETALISDITAGIESEIDVTFRAGQLSNAESRLAQQHVESKFGCDAWTRRR